MAFGSDQVFVPQMAVVNMTGERVTVHALGMSVVFNPFDVTPSDKSGQPNRFQSIQDGPADVAMLMQANAFGALKAVPVESGAALRDKTRQGIAAGQEAELAFCSAYEEVFSEPPNRTIELANRKYLAESFDLKLRQLGIQVEEHWTNDIKRKILRFPYTWTQYSRKHKTLSPVPPPDPLDTYVALAKSRQTDAVIEGAKSVTELERDRLRALCETYGIGWAWAMQVPSLERRVRDHEAGVSLDKYDSMHRKVATAAAQQPSGASA